MTEIVKKLDEQKNRSLIVSDIFVPSVEVLRVRLKDYCERLILKDPVGNVHKIEELLWRKAFYDVVYTAKKLRKVIINNLLNILKGKINNNDTYECIILCCIKKT